MKKIVTKEQVTVSNNTIQYELPIIANQFKDPRRLPTWLLAPGFRRLKPAGYVSRYRPTLAIHDLGERNSICPNCKALHFSSEKVKSSSLAAPRFQTCCKEGQVVLDPIPDPPNVLRRLWTSEEEDAKLFRRDARKYNSAFAFTSFNYTPDRRLEERGIRGGFRSFALHGEIYHMLGSVERQPGERRFAQLYFLDPVDANSIRVAQAPLDGGIVSHISAVIEAHNPFYQYYRTARESLQISNSQQAAHSPLPERRAIINANLQLIMQDGADRRRENLPTVQEFAMVMPDAADRDVRDIVLFIRNSDGSLSTRFQYIHRGHPAYLPLHYVLFYPFGNPGYRWNMPLRTRHQRVLGNQGEAPIPEAANGCVSARQFYRYHIFSRKDSASSPVRFNPLIHGERLFQQILCDMYACVDDNILNWHRQNQDVIRSDLYRGVIDALRTDEPVRNLGEPVILAASYHGGDRHMTQCYQVCPHSFRMYLCLHVSSHGSYSNIILMLILKLILFFVLRFISIGGLSLFTFTLILMLLWFEFVILWSLFFVVFDFNCGFISLNKCGLILI